MEKTITQELLAQTEEICVQRNVRSIPQRLEVLRLIGLQDGATSTYDLPDLLRETESQAKPLTVYCVLESLLRQGSVHKAEPTSSYIFCHLFDQPTHISAMSICDRCGAVREGCAEGVENIMHTSAAKMGFVLWHNVIKIRGLCSACVEVEAYRHSEQCHHNHSIQVKKESR